VQCRYTPRALMLRRLLFPLLYAVPLLALAAERGSRADEPMVDLAEFAPRIVIELRYKGSRHLAKRPLYPAAARAYLRRSVVERLLEAQHWLDAQAPRGTRIKIWDAYRPASAHAQLWAVLPDAEYLGDPAKDGSLHTWGAAVDATLVDIQGRELQMPTDFDVIAPEAKTFYSGSDAKVRKNLRWLQSAMSKAGFYVVRDEWWHFCARDWPEFAPVEMPLVPSYAEEKRTTEGTEPKEETPAPIPRILAPKPATPVSSTKTRATKSPSRPETRPIPRVTEPVIVR